MLSRKQLAGVACLICAVGLVTLPSQRARADDVKARIAPAIYRVDDAGAAPHTQLVRWGYHRGWGGGYGRYGYGFGGYRRPYYYGGWGYRPFYGAYYGGVPYGSYYGYGAYPGYGYGYGYPGYGYGVGIGIW